ncbi:MAG: hypothetical protein UHU19_07305 [Lachnospiraceae bacterium]|nr:hypothetical protein [Lachnospiraceae bacterium]
MKDIGIVQGSAAQAKPLIVNKDTVYVHTDINPATDAEGNEIKGLYEYHEIQYGKDEYISVISDRSMQTEQEVTNLQMVVCALYELLG